MESNNQLTGEAPYPVQFSVEYPDRDLNRLTTGFRLIVAIPILILAATVGPRVGWLRPRPRDRCGDRRGALPGAALDDRLSSEVPALVVRLEPRAAQVR